MEVESRNDLIDELLSRIETGRELSNWLLASAGQDEERRQAVGDAISAAARRLAPNDEPPADAAAAWRSLLTAADLLYGSGVEALGRLPFLSDGLFNLLVTESREQRPPEAETGRRTVGEAGRALAGLAVSRQLREALSQALGFPARPTYDAIYMYEPPGSHVRTHMDARDYELVFHLVLEHTLPDGSAGSALVVHRAGEPAPTRLRFQPGEAVVLRGRGTIHSWEPLAVGERRTLTAVGFAAG